MKQCEEGRGGSEDASVDPSETFCENKDSDSKLKGKS